MLQSFLGKVLSLLTDQSFFGTIIQLDFYCYWECSIQSVQRVGEKGMPTSNYHVAEAWLANGAVNRYQDSTH